MDYLSASPPPDRIVSVRDKKVKEKLVALGTNQTVFELLHVDRKAANQWGFSVPFMNRFMTLLLKARGANNRTSL
jgi:hypothetical protein